MHVIGKFRKERDIPMQPDAQAAIAEQIDAEGRLWRQNPQRLREVLVQGADRVKIPRITPHALRHTPAGTSRPDWDVMSESAVERLKCSPPSSPHHDDVDQSCGTTMATSPVPGADLGSAPWRHQTRTLDGTTFDEMVLMPRAPIQSAPSSRGRARASVMRSGT